MKLGKVASIAILWAFSTAAVASAATIIIDDAVAAAIPDNSSISFNINISDTGTVSDVTVRFNLTHPQMGDIRITLSNPTGGVVDVVNRVGGPNFNRNYGGFLYSFNDANVTNFWTAATGVSGGTNASIPGGNYLAPFDDLTTVPLNPALAGNNVQGTWTLTVYDVAGGNIGSLASWGLTIETGSTPPPPSSVPEPSTYLLFGLGLGGLATLRHKR